LIKADTGLYPEPVESIPHPHNPFFKTRFNIVRIIIIWIFRNGRGLWGLDGAGSG
jgi:hypothetical protein